MPARSRISTNSSPPRSRTRCTHPSSTTSAPTSSVRKAPHVCVRVRSPSCSATLFQRLEYRRACCRLVVGLLGLRGKVLDRKGPSLDFRVADQRHERDPPAVSVLDLLAYLVGVGIDKHAQPMPAQFVGDTHRVWRAGAVE